MRCFLFACSCFGKIAIRDNRIEEVVEFSILAFDLSQQ